MPGESRDIVVRYLADGLGVHSAAIRLDFSYDEINYQAVDLQLTGETVNAPNAQIWLGDSELPLAEETGTITGPGLDTLTLSVDHKYAGPCDPTCVGTYADQTSEYELRRGSTYVIVSDFGGSKDGRLLKQRQRKLEKYRTEQDDTSRDVLTEALNIMGQTWMQQTTLSDRLLYQLLDVSIVKHHGFGIAADESAVRGGYYIDVKTQFIHSVSRYNDPADEDACFKASGFLTSALEHGVLEQLQGEDRPAASTIKLMYLASEEDQRIYLADDVDDYLNNIKPNLTGYNFDFDTSNGEPDDFEARIENGAIYVLPANGKIELNDWEGSGYIEFIRKPDGTFSMGMIIGGEFSYYGAFSVFAEEFSVPSLYQEFFPELSLIAFRDPMSLEPVNMKTGAYYYEHSDISVGAAEPRGLNLTRYYNSDDSNNKSSLGYGWTHSYNTYLKVHSDVEAGLAMRQPVDAAAMLASSVVTLDLMTPSDPDVKEWMTAVLIGKWSMDRLFENAVSVHLKDKVHTYLELPDGTYNPPPGITTELIFDSGSYRLEERFGTKMFFEDIDSDPDITDNRISEWKDIDDNTMTFTYTGDKLTTVRDAFNRTLTLNYTGELLTSVVDDSSIDRLVSYDHTDDELTTYTDTEGKLWGYGYDSGNLHHMTVLTDPLNITTATNAYDSLGRVMTQQVPRQTALGTYADVIYQFYFTEYKSEEEDPDGNYITYYFDDKGRQVGQRSQTGSYVANEYDGQDHVIKTIDPRGYETVFTYDGYQNLIRTTNALTQSIDNIYDSQFRLTDTVDPLFHGSHTGYDNEHHPELAQYGAEYVYNDSTETFDKQNDGLFQSESTYYADGMIETSTDGEGTVTGLTYDTYGNPATSTTGSHPAVTTAYNSIGLMTSLTDQIGAETTFPEYNQRGQLKRKTDPLLNDIVMEYDDAGRLDYIIDRNGDRIDYTYTHSGKVETITYEDSSTVSFLYNVHDNVREMQDDQGTTIYTYYDDHSLETMTDSHGFQIGYVYDVAGNLTELTYPGNNRVIYTYDALNRLETVTIDWLTPSRTATYHYDEAGRLDYVENFNGTVTDYDYDNANRLTDLVSKKSDETIIADYHFILDGNGSITDVTRNEPLSPVVVLSTTDYDYNDPIKNRLNGTDSVLRFNYDDEGQLSVKDSISYGFDYAHRLESIGANIQFSYDGKSNRIKAIRDSIETRYIYDASGNLVADADSDNVVTKYYIYGLG